MLGGSRSINGKVSKEIAMGRVIVKLINSAKGEPIREPIMGVHCVAFVV